MQYTQNNIIVTDNNGKLLRQTLINEISYQHGTDISTIDNHGLVEYVAPTSTPLTLDQVYQAKISEISNARTEASNSTFEHDGKTFSANTLAKESILSTHGEVLATSAMPTGWIGAWLDSTGQPYLIANVTQWKAFYNSYYTTGLNLAGKAAMLQSAATVIYNDTAKTDNVKISEINAISW
jgi:hypothetical protein